MKSILKKIYILIIKQVIIPNFKIEDLVRISLKRRDIFDKPSGNIKWSEDLSKIHSINRSNVITYKIKDLNDEIIKGIFYESNRCFFHF